MANRSSALNSCLDSNVSGSLITATLWEVSPDLTTLGIITGTVMLTFLLIGLPSNILIITSILLQKLYRQPTYLFLLSLAFADTLMCLLVMPTIIVSGIAGEFVLGESDYARCKVCQLGIALVTVGLFSLHILALISLDRFLFIQYPLRYEKMVTKYKVIASIVVVCLLSLLLGILPLFRFGDIYFDHRTFSCSPQLEGTSATKNIYYMVLVAVEAVLPLSVLTVTNIWILCIARKHIKQIYNIKRSFAKVSEQEMYYQGLRTKLHQQNYRKQLQLIRTFGVIFIAHLITWIPLLIRIFEALILNMDVDSQWSNFIIIVSITLFPVVHPLIEACILPEMRRYFIIKCCRKNRADTEKNSFCSCSYCNSCLDIFNATILLPKTELEQIQNDVCTHNKD